MHIMTQTTKWTFTDEADSSPPVQRQALPLSPTEKRVCALLLQRLTENKIAAELDRSPNTVHVHVRNIYRKLGISKRHQLHNYPGIVSMVISK